MLLSLDIYSTDQVIDLPIAIDETGAMNILSLDGYNQPHESSCNPTYLSPEVSSPSSACQSTSANMTSVTTAEPCNRSDLTEETLERYRKAYDSGVELDDSMYYSWKYYTSGVKNTAIKSESKMLSFPTQVNKKVPKRKASRRTSSSRLILRTKKCCPKKKRKRKRKLKLKIENALERNLESKKNCKNKLNKHRRK